MSPVSRQWWSRLESALYYRSQARPQSSPQPPKPRANPCLSSSHLVVSQTHTQAHSYHRALVCAVCPPLGTHSPETGSTLLWTATPTLTALGFALLCSGRPQASVLGL